MVKKLLLLLTAVLVAGFATEGSAQSFPDSSGTPYETAINSLVSAGVINGYPDGTVKPYNPISRSEALKIILRAEGSLAAEADAYARRMPSVGLFPDVDQTAWYAPYVEVSYRKGIVKGYPDGFFRPGNLVSTEEATALLMRAFGEDGAGLSYQTSSAYENRPNQWYTGYVNVAISKNLAMKNGTLIPGRAMTRGQLFDMVYRLRDVKSKRIVAYNGAEPAGNTSPTVPSQTGGKRAQGIPASAMPQFASTTSAFAINIPSLGIKDVAVIHPTDATTSKGILEVLYAGLGHLFAYPGQGDKIMIYGHSSGYPWDISEYTKIFRKINELKEGDRAYLTYNNQVYVYQVSRHQVVEDDDASPFQSDGNGEELILYTCWPPDSIDQRYLVHLVPVNTVQ